MFIKFISIYNIYNSRTTLQIYESHHRFYIRRLFKLCYFSVYFLYFTILLYIYFYHARKTKTKNSNFQVQSIVPCTDQKSSDRSMLHGAENLAVHPPINFLLPEATRKWRIQEPSTFLLLHCQNLKLVYNIHIGWGRCERRTDQIGFQV